MADYAFRPIHRSRVQTLALPRFQFIPLRGKVRAYPGCQRMTTVELDAGSRAGVRRKAEKPQQRSQPMPTVATPVTILSTDAELCEALRTAAAEIGPVSIGARLEDAEALAAHGRCAILVTDQATNQLAVARMTQRMRVHDPATITIAVGSREDDNALIGMLSSAVVERFMLKPVTPSLARLVLRSAAKEYQALKSRSGADSGTTRDKAVSRPQKQEPIASTTMERPVIAVSRAHPRCIPLACAYGAAEPKHGFTAGDDCRTRCGSEQSAQVGRETNMAACRRGGTGRGTDRVVDHVAAHARYRSAASHRCESAIGRTGARPATLRGTV